MPSEDFQEEMALQGCARMYEERVARHLKPVLLQMELGVFQHRG